MQIISNRRLLFEDVEYTTDPKTETIVARVKSSIIVNPNIHPQIVPDWVKNTKLFELTESDGNVIEVSVNSAPKAAKKADGAIKFQAVKIPEAEVVIPGGAVAPSAPSNGAAKAAWPASSADINTGLPTK